MLQTEPQPYTPTPPNPLFIKEEEQKAGGFEQPSMIHSFRFYAEEREIAAMKPPMKVSQWAPKYRYVPKGAHVGLWDNSIVPYAAFIMDTWQLPWVREVYLVGTSQSAKTNIMHTCCAYTIEYSPADTLFVMPDKLEAEGMASDRIIPMIEQSPSLAKHLSPNPDDTAQKKIRLRNGMTIYMAWANSASQLASKAIKYIFADETEKYPAQVGEETDPITLMKKRKKTFRHTYKLMMGSTPKRENGHIMKEANAAQVYYERAVYCPCCGVAQLMNFEQFRWPKEKTAVEIETGDLATYECEHCKEQWTTRMRDAAVKAADEWIPTRGGDIKRPRTVAFHIPAWLSLDMSLGAIAATYIKAQTAEGHGDKAPMIDFYNDTLAEAYVEKKSERKEDAILALRDDRPRGLVPKDADCLICLIDTQQRGFYYEVRAFEYGASLTSWQVREGFVESFEGIKQILYNDEYLDSDGRQWAINYAFMDSGGGTGTVPKHSRTAEVYDFCLANPGVKPLKGRQTMESKTAPKILDHYPNSKKPIPGGLTLYHINVTYFKNQLTGKLQVNPGDPGAWNLHSEASEDYARQMCAEYQDEKGHWQCPKGRANHYWDCYSEDTEVLAIDGWKFFSNLSGHELLATVNLETDQIEYQKPQFLIKKEYSGAMISIKGRRIDLLVTPQHRMVTYRKKQQKGKIVFNVPPAITLAQDLDIWHRIKLTAQWTGRKYDTINIPASINHGSGRIQQPARDIAAGDWAEFLGWYVAEGYRRIIKSPTQGKSILRRVLIAQIKADGRNKISQLLQKLPWKWHYDGKNFVITSKQLFDAVQECGDGSKNKKIPDWIKKANVELIHRFISGAIAGDGWIEPNGGLRYATTSRLLADDMQELFIKIGLSPSLSIRKKGNPRHNDQYWVTGNSTKTAHLRDKDNRSIIKETLYDGMVFCATVPNGTLIVRRNGKISICGNCAVYSLAAAEILQLKFKKKEEKAAAKPVRKIYSKGVAHES